MSLPRYLLPKKTGELLSKLKSSIGFTVTSKSRGPGDVHALLAALRLWFRQGVIGGYFGSEKRISNPLSCYVPRKGKSHMVRFRL